MCKWCSKISSLHVLHITQHVPVSDPSLLVDLRTSLFFIILDRETSSAADQYLDIDGDIHERAEKEEICA